VLVLVDEEPIDASLKRFHNGMTRVLLPFDDEDVVRVFSTAMKDQIRPEPPRVIFTPIRPRRQPLLMVKVPVIVKVDGEFVVESPHIALVIPADGDRCIWSSSAGTRSALGIPSGTADQRLAPTRLRWPHASCARRPVLWPPG
jgi:hypothetical protein